MWTICKWHILISTSHALQRPGQPKYVPNGRQHDMNKGSGVSSTASNSLGGGSQGPEMLSSSMLAAASPEQQKQILGERLFPLVHKHKVMQCCFTWTNTYCSSITDLKFTHVCACSRILLLKLQGCFWRWTTQNCCFYWSLLSLWLPKWGKLFRSSRSPRLKYLARIPFILVTFLQRLQ